MDRSLPPGRIRIPGRQANGRLPRGVNRARPRDRAVAPVVGIALLIAITVILAAVVGAVILGIGVGPAEAPQTTLSFDSDGDDVYLIHDGGEPLPADEVRIVYENGTVVDELVDDLTAGERKALDDVEEGERISVVWQDPSSDSEVVLTTFRP